MRLAADTREGRVERPDVVKLWADLDKAVQAISDARAYVDATHGPLHTSECFEDLLADTRWKRPEGYDTLGLYGRMKDALAQPLHLLTRLRELETEIDAWCNDDKGGYDQAIGLLCKVKDQLAALRQAQEGK